MLVAHGGVYYYPHLGALAVLVPRLASRRRRRRLLIGGSSSAQHSAVLDQQAHHLYLRAGQAPEQQPAERPARARCWCGAARGGSHSSHSSSSEQRPAAWNTAHATYARGLSAPRYAVARCLSSRASR